MIYAIRTLTAHRDKPAGEALRAFTKYIAENYKAPGFSISLLNNISGDISQFHMVTTHASMSDWEEANAWGTADEGLAAVMKKYPGPNFSKITDSFYRVVDL